MLKKSILILFLSVLSVCVNAQEGWFKQKISEKVSVTFPLEPKKINEQNYGIKDAEGVVYLVSFVDLLKATGMPLNEFNEKIKAQQFADDFMGGLTPTMPKFIFKAAKISTLKGYTAYQVIGRDEPNKSTIAMNIVFVDGIAYSITNIITDGKNTKNRDIFLTNISITK
ncbi:hypothetical protein FA048_10470 [Pedobacter polaris]|uniref:Uncharacterized protein n=1 Tax=Pedobacter polaris TaxID=2571273 RepID=A0A4U1CU09_9SPHI|nr:hypothetical protein [Pedobacter polaris]TKC10595.1 hypothetical protein FA048_10470 [Pedobacter polaris]